MKSVLAISAAAVVTLVLAAGEVQAQTWTCEIVGAKSCSDARTQCLRIIRKNMGDRAESKWCAAPHTKCLATGVWKGSVCNISGLRKE
jgi:hypothetical protein